MRANSSRSLSWDCPRRMIASLTASVSGPSGTLRPSLGASSSIARSISAYCRCRRPTKSATTTCFALEARSRPRRSLDFSSAAPTNAGSPSMASDSRTRRKVSFFCSVNASRSRRCASMNLAASFGPTTPERNFLSSRLSSAAKSALERYSRTERPAALSALCTRLATLAAVPRPLSA